MDELEEKAGSANATSKAIRLAPDDKGDANKEAAKRTTPDGKANAPSPPLIGVHTVQKQVEKMGAVMQPPQAQGRPA